MGKQSDIVNFHNCFEREGFGNIYLIHQPNPNAKHIDDVPFLQECFILKTAILHSKGSCKSNYQL